MVGAGCSGDGYFWRDALALGFLGGPAGGSGACLDVGGSVVVLGRVERWMVMCTYRFLRTFPLGGLRKENSISRSWVQRDQHLVEPAGIKLVFKEMLMLLFMEV
jgi:hypothetical protein